MWTLLLRDWVFHDWHEMLAECIAWRSIPRIELVSLMIITSWHSLEFSVAFYALVLCWAVL
jgi:hypothetical protein